MATSGINKARNTLPGSKEHAATGKEKAVVAPSSRAVHPEPQAAQRNRSRKARVREDVDSDYAEEAEDFFYGEGM
jgi:hypothetical protein